MTLTVRGFVVQGQNLVVLPFEPPGQSQHHQHQDRLERRNSKHGKACLNPIAFNAGRAAHFAKQRLQGVGGWRQPLDYGK